MEELVRCKYCGKLPIATFVEFEGKHYPAIECKNDVCCRVPSDVSIEDAIERWNEYQLREDSEIKRKIMSFKDFVNNSISRGITGGVLSSIPIALYKAGTVTHPAFPVIGGIILIVTIVSIMKDWRI